MKEFILKSTYLVAPFLIAYMTFATFWSPNKGDLIRVGYFIDNTGNYRERLQEDISPDIDYMMLENSNLETSFDVFTVGDSFSQQKQYGYQNVLAKEGKQVLHSKLLGNPIQNLTSLLNGNLFDSISVNYVILESVERQFIDNVLNLDRSKAIYLSDIRQNEKKLISKQKPKEASNAKPNFFNPGVIKLPLYRVLYQWNDHAYFSKVYKVSIQKQLFSTGNQDLLFFSDDLKPLNQNNDYSKVELINNELNQLSASLQSKGIQLIVLPCPDKYDLYFDFITDKSKYNEPKFFDYLSSCTKDYIYIDSKQILQELLSKKQDVYYYDDTHWSPVAANEIGEYIAKTIEGLK